MSFVPPGVPGRSGAPTTVHWLRVVTVDCGNHERYARDDPYGRQRAVAKSTRKDPDADHFSGVPSARKCSRARDS